jgi:hypothetical protein
VSSKNAAFDCEPYVTMDTEPNITDILSVIIAGIDNEKYYQVCLMCIYIGSRK